jgi:ABC-2 type transport system ATP-binding protein
MTLKDRQETGEALIEAEGFSKSYDGTLAVEDLSFAVNGGEILGLVGPNGAGKTTTLRALAGILPPSAGTLRIAGRDVVRQPLEAKRRLALVPDDPNLFPAMTVPEHLEFTAKVYRVRGWKERAGKLLERLEMLEHCEKLADELSRGMRQKAAIACALLHEPSALLLDEPLTGLDPRAIRTLYDALRQRAREGGAVIVSTHLLSQIEALCSRFLILSRGRRLFYGSKDEIRAEIDPLSEDASLEEIFFKATEGRAASDAGPSSP